MYVEAERARLLQRVYNDQDSTVSSNERYKYQVFLSSISITRSLKHTGLDCHIDTTMIHHDCIYEVGTSFTILMKLVALILRIMILILGQQKCV